jgi:dethiobiotin synthetase
MSPIASDGLNIDLIAALARPAILVGGTYLGAISHTLTAITALRAHSIELWGLVINETAGSSVDFAATVGSLVRFAPHVRVMTLRYGQQTIPELPDLPPVP